jgi:hypothetical protein
LNKISFILLLSLIISLLSGCTSKKPKVTNQFRSLASVPVEMTEEEAKLNDCITSAKISCYELYPYEEVTKRWGDSDEDLADRTSKVRSHFHSCIIDHSMTCAELAGRDDLVQNLELSKQDKEAALNIIPGLDWFFLSPKKISRFISFIKRINEVKSKIAKRTKQVLKTSKNVSIKLMHGHGVGVTGSAFGLVGTSFTGEALVLDGDINLFCAPGLQVVTDAGIQANFTGVRALSCDNSQSYKGKFFTLFAGLSAEAIALPVGIEAAYSFGMDSSKLLKEMIYYKNKGQLNPSNLFAEYLLLNSVLPVELAKAAFSKKHKFALWLAIKLGMQLTDEKGPGPSIDKELRGQGVSLDDIVKMKGVSLGHLIKYVTNSQTFQNILSDYKLRNLKIFFKALSKSMSGCDSISGSITVGLTASPINLGVQLTHYEKIFSAKLDKILSLRNLTAFALMNPFLMDKEMLFAVADLAKLVTNFSDVVKNQCYRPAGKKLKETYYLIDELRK